MINAREWRDASGMRWAGAAARGIGLLWRIRWSRRKGGGGPEVSDILIFGVPC